MSKKKQLAGKKTKLANLPLTAALSRQIEGSGDGGRPPAASETGLPQLPLSWESLEEGAAGLLNAAYVLVVRDLLRLTAEFPWTASEGLVLKELSSQTALPAQEVKQALRQAKEELSDLYRLLSE